jgi:Na+/H+ antiporter NhaB
VQPSGLLTSCSFGKSRRFGGEYRLHIQVRGISQAKKKQKTKKKKKQQAERCFSLAFSWFLPWPTV